MASTPAKKVRVACQRCRGRRIRCDGGVPSCANCAKAGTPCVDVDARNAEQLIPRNSLIQAKARIQWLEDVISTRLPDIDLSAAPPVEFDGADLLNQSEEAGQAKSAGRDPQPPIQGARSNKRPHASFADDEGDHSFNTEARSVALDLGRLSLITDSREKHYLGSSSGLLFSYLIGTPPGATDELTSIEQTTLSESHQQNRKSFQQLHRALVSGLPAKDDALLLFSIFVQHIYPDHPVIHIPSLLSALDSLYICSDLDVNVQVDQHGWPLTLSPFPYNGEIYATKSQPGTPISLPAAMFHCFMIFTLAATIRLGGSQNEFAPAPFFRIAKKVALDALSDSSIPGLQGVYLLAVHALMTPANLNVWTLTYVCMAHAIELGIHREQESLPPAAKTTRSLLFHSIYSLDRMVATIQGRPLGIRDETFDVKLPTLDELLADIGNHSLTPVFEAPLSHTAFYSLSRFKLDKIISDIKTIFYFLPDRINPSVWSTDYGHHQQRIQQDLDSWYADVCELESTSAANDGDRRRWQLNLEQQYCAAMVLLFQPSQVFRQPDDERFRQCFDAASRQIQCYNSLYEELDMLIFDFRTVRNIFACGATIVYCFWSSKNLQLGSYANQMPNTLRLCTTLLAVGAIWWPSVKKGRLNFQKLVDLTVQRWNDVKKKDPERSRKRRSQRARLSYDQRLSSQMIPTQSGQSQASLYPGFGAHNEQDLSGVLGPDQQFEGEPSDQWQRNEDLTFGIVGERNLGMASHPDFEDVSPSHDLTNVPSHVEPEIAAFLSDYFLDDSSWNLTDAGPPLSFHFGNL